MPTNRTRKPRSKMTPEVPDWQIEFLKSGKLPERGEPFAFEARMIRDHSYREIWEEKKQEILPRWIAKKPGTRPHGWWEFSKDCPRQKDDGTWFRKNLAIPRVQVSGIELSSGPETAVVPYLFLGVDLSFKHINFLGNPPKFESQANYLKRYGLLKDSEKKKLKAKDFEPETIMKIFGKKNEI